MKFEIRKIVSETMKSSIPDDTQRENFGKEWENNLWVASKKLGIEFEEAQSIFSTWPLESILDGFLDLKYAMIFHI